MRATEIRRLDSVRVTVGTMALNEAPPPTVAALLARGLAAPEPEVDAPMFIAIAVGVDLIGALEIVLPLVLDRALGEARVRPRWYVQREAAR